MIRLSKRNVNRLALIALIAAPLLYLFGTQFAALAGAHGEEVFAEPVYTNEYVEVNDFSSDGDYKLSVDSFENVLVPDNFVSSGFNFNFVFAGFNENIVTIFFYSSSNIIGFRGDSYLDIARYNLSDNVYYQSQPSPLVLEFSYQSNAVRFVDFLKSLSVSLTLYKILPVPTAVVPQNNSAYTDYLFGNMFGKSNFLTDWGVNSISDDPLGFAPIGNFYQWLDVNLLHLSNSQIGLMAYGYSYYLAHVLLFDLFFYTCTFFISFLFGLFDKFGGSGL